MLKARIVIFISLLLLSQNQALVSLAQHTDRITERLTGSGVTTGELGAQLDEYLSRAAAFGFSGAVLVEKDGQVILHKGYGLAHRERGVPITTETVFYLASLTKEFTAAAILKLEMQGKLKTTDTISKYLEGIPTDKAEITIHHLLTHTSGLREVREERPLTRDEFIKAAINAPPRSAPGKQYAYLNTGYILLAAMIEKVSGQSYSSYLEQYLFKPAGMTKTGFINDASKWSAANLAQAYNGTLDEGEAILSHHQPYSWLEFGATGIVSSPGELYQWELALRGDTILSKEAKEKFFTPFLENYAYGWVVEPTQRGTKLIWHTGQLLPEGWNSQYRRYVDDRVTVIITSNVNQEEPLGWVAARQLTRLIFGGEVAMPPAIEKANSSELSKYVGTYTLSPGAQFKIRMEGHQLLIEGQGQPAINLLLYQDRKQLDRHKDDNQRAAQFIDQLSHGDFDALKEMLDTGRPFDTWKQQLSQSWQWMVEHFGQFERAEVINSVADEDPQGLLRTFIRLHFNRQSTVIRTFWRAGKFNGMSDKGAFVGKAKEVPVVPGALPLAQESASRFATFDFATSKSCHISFRSAGREIIKELVFHASNGELVAEKTK